MVPNGWEIRSLEDVVSKTRKITYGIVVPGPNTQNGNLMIRAQDYSFGWKSIDSMYRVSDKVHESYKRSQVNEGDVLLTIVGSIGKTAIIPKHLEGANLTQQTARLSFDKHDEGFFHAIMSSPIGKKEIYRFAKSGVQPSLNLSDIAKFKIPVPPLPEQRKIASILGTWDKAISTTERLIDNSKQQKKALMQQLLTGAHTQRKRLLDDSGKPFDGGWKTKHISDAFKVGSSKRVLQADWCDNGVPFYRTRELVSLAKREPFRNEIFISEELFCQISEKYGLPVEGDFLVSGVGTLGVIYKVKNKDRFYFKDGNVLWFKSNGSIDSDYFYHCFKSNYIQNQIVNQTTITTVGTYTISNAKQTKFLCPPTVKEQQKIAAVLTNADQEIELLEQQLADLKQEKKALMQQLLTGKRRVIV